MRFFSTSLAALGLTLLAHFAWAEEAAWRPAADAGQPVIIRVQATEGGETAPRVVLGAPSAAAGVRLGAPTVRKEMAPADGAVRPSVFAEPAILARPTAVPPSPQPTDEKLAEPRLVPEPEPIAAPKTKATAAPGGGYFLAAPGSAEGVSSVAPPGYAPDGAPCASCGAGLPCGECPACCGEGMPCGCMFEGPHGPMSRAYIDFEFLLWRLKGDSAPPLVTAGTESSAGVIGQNGTRVLLGGNLDEGLFLGGRIQAGVWFDPCERYGIVGSFFMLQQRSKTWTFASNGDPLLARPFFNANGGGFEDSELVAAQDLVRGAVSVQEKTQLLGADLNFRLNLLHSGWPVRDGVKTANIDFIAGFRYLRLNDSLTISEDLTDGPQGQDPGARTFIQDRFRTANDFYGGQIGLMAEMRHNSWFLNLTAKVAFGATQQHVGIDGSSTFDLTDAPPVTQPNGILALRTNSGSYSHTAFSIVPELGVNLGYQITDHCRVYVGYNLLFWTNVARPGEQIDRTVNPENWPSNVDPGGRNPPLRPAFAFHDSTFWAQGLVAGFEWRF